MPSRKIRTKPSSKSGKASSLVGIWALASFQGEDCFEPGTFFELREDGTWQYREGNTLRTGTYSVRGAVVSLSAEGYARRKLTVLAGELVERRKLEDLEHEIETRYRPLAEVQDAAERAIGGRERA